MDFRVLFFGALLDLGITLIEPLLRGDRRLFVGATDGILRCEASALEILAYAAHRQVLAALALDQKHDGSLRPQSEI